MRREPGTRTTLEILSPYLGRHASGAGETDLWERIRPHHSGGATFYYESQ